MLPHSFQDTITVLDLKKLLEAEYPLILLDVREASELQICKLMGSIHIPLGKLSVTWDQLPKDQLIVVYCHHGYRSGVATQFLRTQGFQEVVNLTGGIQAWAEKVDPTMTRY